MVDKTQFGPCPCPFTSDLAISTVLFYIYLESELKMTACVCVILLPIFVFPFFLCLTPNHLHISIQIQLTCLLFGSALAACGISKNKGKWNKNRLLNNSWNFQLKIVWFCSNESKCFLQNVVNSFRCPSLYSQYSLPKSNHFKWKDIFRRFIFMLRTHTYVHLLFALVFFLFLFLFQCCRFISPFYRMLKPS